MLIRLRGCAGWSAPLLFAYAIRHIFAWPGPYVFFGSLVVKCYMLRIMWLNIVYLSHIITSLLTLTKHLLVSCNPKIEIIFLHSKPNISSPSIIYNPHHDKTNKLAVRPAKTQISLGIRPVWPESSLSTWRHLGSLATRWAYSEDSDQTGQMPRLIWVFAGRTVPLLVLSCHGSYCILYQRLTLSCHCNEFQ